MKEVVVPGLVSVIIPVYNRAAMLGEAVGSVLAQSYGKFEIIIVDDGSTDDTPQAANALAASRRNEITVLRQHNAGPGHARETGRNAVRGEFVQYLDSDDLLLPGKLDIQVRGLMANPGAGVAYGITRFRDADGTVRPGPWKGSGLRQATMFPSFLVDRWWDTPNPLYRRAVCDQAGPWLPLRAEEDWEYDCRIASFGPALHYCPSYVVEVRNTRDPAFRRHAAFDPAVLRDRAQAHAAIYRHARTAGLDPSAPEMQRFARALFFLARRCGAVGLTEASRSLFELSRQACGTRRASAADFKVYELGARLLGWKTMGRVTCALETVR